MIWPLLILFRVPLEYVFSLDFLLLAKVVAFILFIWGAIYTAKQTQTIRRIGFAMVLLAIGALSFDLSSRLFLGKVVGEIYIAEAPAFIELEVYSGGTCVMAYGGIFGVSEVYYCQYTIQGDALLIVTDERIFDLQGQHVNVHGKELTIGRNNE